MRWKSWGVASQRVGHDTNVCAGCTNNGVRGDVQTLVTYTPSLAGGDPARTCLGDSLPRHHSIAPQVCKRHLAAISRSAKATAIRSKVSFSRLDGRSESSSGAFNGASQGHIVMRS